MNNFNLLYVFVSLSQVCSAQLDVVYNVLVWSDEFDTAGVNNPVNLNNWHHQTKLIDGWTWPSGEVQHYTDRLDNSFVQNGFLNIVAKKENYTDQGYTKAYTSARLNSKFAFTYGRVDVRAKLPIEKGTWPAIWTLGKNIIEPGGYWDPAFGTIDWPACGEIDIMEHGIFDWADKNYIQGASHTTSSWGNTPNNGGIVISDVENDFHVYSLNWSPNQLTFMVDDVVFYIYNPSIKNPDSWPYNTDQYILLNVAMGGVAGAIDPAFTQSSMTIDYVRIYQEVPLSINEDELGSKIKVYPNPAHTTITINSKLKIDKVELFDVFGKRIIIKNELIDKIDVNNLISGIYLLNIYSNQQKVTKKVVVFN